MSFVVLQPCSGTASRRHYEQTIKSPVALARIQDVLDPADSARLSEIYPQGLAPLWGTTPGERGQHVTKWSRMRAGDVILFAQDGGFFTVGVVTHLLRNQAAARRLWGTGTTRNGVEQTWECMFALDDLREVSISYEDVNAVVGRKPNAVVQEFQVLSQDKSDAVLAFLDMVGNEYAPPPEEEEYRRDLDDPNFSQMEFRIETFRRAEQAFLRQRLFPGKTARCAICDREFPIQFLIAAHIKRRSACNQEEKRDYDHIVMPNCTFGCDVLFGQGVIAVGPDGAFETSEAHGYGDAVVDYLRDYIIGRQCRIWHERPSSRPYFAFHRTTDFRAPIKEFSLS